MLRPIYDEGDRVVAVGTWLYDGVSPREVRVIARNPKFAHTRFDDEDKLIDSAPIPSTIDGSIYVVDQAVGAKFLLTLEEAKRWAESQPWGPITWQNSTTSLGEVIDYSNGPLPAFLSYTAYITPDGKEFALRKPDALYYLNWCEAHLLLVSGFDAWKAKNGDFPTVVLEHGFEGDLQASRRSIQAVDDEGLLFNLWTHRK